MPLSSDILPARLNQADIPALYRWIAPTHDLAARLLESRARRLGLAWAAIQDGESILEVAVGTGLTFKEVLNLNPSGRNEGVDLTEAMLRKARRRAARHPDVHAHLQLGDAYALPFPNGSFDLVINNYMFDLLPQAGMPLVLHEFQRVLRPGGRLVLTSLTKGRRWFHHLWDGLYRIHPAILGGCRGVRLESPVRAAGFEHVRSAFVSQMTFPSEVVLGFRPPVPSDLLSSV